MQTPGPLTHAAAFERFLEPERLRLVSSQIDALRLDREALVGALAPPVVQALQRLPGPTEQVLSDLEALNRLVLDEGAPLRAYLDRAAQRNRRSNTSPGISSC